MEKGEVRDTTSDDVQTMEVSVRDYRDKLDQVSQQFERLEKKDDVINRVMKDVDTSFTHLKTLEQKINDYSRQVTSLPQEIKDVQASVDRLLQNGPKITEAASKLNNLQNALTETQKRLDVIQDTNGSIKKTELELQSLKREIDSKFEMLHAITKQEESKKVSKKDSAISPAERDTIRALKREGWSINEIASRFNRTPTEIDLLLSLPE